MDQPARSVLSVSPEQYLAEPVDPIPDLLGANESSQQKNLQPWTRPV
jgi:hypothetical protein